MNNRMIRVIVICIVIILALVGIVVQQQTKISKIRTDRDQAIQFANTEKMMHVIYKNKFGRETMKAHVLDISLRNAKEFINNDRLSFVTQFNGVNKRLNNLEQATTTTAQIVKEWQLPLGDTTIVNIDSSFFHAKKFAYHDSLNSISGIIKGDTIIPKISITVPLQGVVYWQRNKVLGLHIGRKKWFSDITSTNPSVTIKSHEIIVIKNKR